MEAHITRSMVENILINICMRNITEEEAEKRQKNQLSWHCHVYKYIESGVEGQERDC